MKLIQRASLLIFFFSINFEVWDPFNTGGSFSLAKLTGFIYLVMMLPSITSFVSRKDVKYFLNPVLFFFLFLTLINILNKNSNLQNFLNISIFQNICLFYILLNHEIIDHGILEKGLISFAIGSIVFALLYSAGIGVEISAGGRVSVFGDNQNPIAMRSCISILIIIFSVIQNPLNLGKLRYILFLPVPLMIQLIVVTASRAAILSFILSVLFMVILMRNKNIWVKILIFMIALLMLAAAWMYTVQSEVLSIRLLSSLQDRDLSGREIIWQNIAPLIKDNFIFGVGTVGYLNFSQDTFGYMNSPHNVFLEILCYTGIIGLMIYMVFLYRIFLKSYELYRNKKILLPLILLFPILGTTISSQILEVKTGWILFAYIAGTSQILTNSSDVAKTNIHNMNHQDRQP